MTSLDGRMRRPPALPALSAAPPWLLAALLSLPLTVALISRLFTGYWWWNDFDAIACAGAQAQHGAPIYAVGAACASLRPAAFVYAPMVARAVGVLLDLVGLTQLKAIYVAIYVAAAAWLSLALFRTRAIEVAPRDRLPGLALITGGVIACGNIAILCHALALGALFAFPRRRLPFIAAVAVAAAIKPVFATYLVVLLLDRTPLKTRALQIGMAAVLVGGAIAASFLTAGPDAAAWSAALRHVVLQGRPGIGFLGWVSPLRLGDTNPAALAAYAVFAALMIWAAHRFTRLADFTQAQTWLYAVGVAQLLNPRLMGYDLQILAPAIALAIGADARLGLGDHFKTGRVLWLICLAAWALGCLSLVPIAAGLAPPAIALVFVAGGLLIRRSAEAAQSTQIPATQIPATQIPAAQIQRLRPNPHHPELSLVICTLDEHECIGRVIGELDAALSSISHEIIVVDDSADERTADAVLSVIARGGCNVRLIRRSGVRGLASAAIAGWDAARGEVLGVMDGDGQHDPRKLREIYDRLIASGADVALVSRYAGDTGTGLTGFRDIISRIATRVTRVALGVRVTDPMSGQFVFHRGWYDQVRPRLSGVGFKILLDVVASGSAAPRTVEARGALRPRIAGESKLDFRVMADLVALLIAKRTNGLLSARFALFAAVGALGVGVHLATLEAAKLLGGPFWLAQGLAIFTAMTSNFFLNNALTFRDARLTGAAAVKGLGLFYASCSVGALISEGLAVAVTSFTSAWILAALAGAVVGAVVNYSFSRAFTWRVGQVGTERASPSPEAGESDLGALVREIHLSPAPSLALAVGQD
ncbi:MAG TPA: glycosyltransferase [Caulobacteraceae bacterium]